MILYRRDRGTCQWCSEKKALDELTIDHIVEVQNGGTNRLSNLRLLCDPCHTTRNKLSTDERVTKDGNIVYSV